MKATRQQQAVIQKLVEQQGADLRALVDIAGLDPATDLLGADFRDAQFGTDDLSGFNLSRADLRGADLSHARGLDRAMFAEVITDGRTRWPRRHEPLPGSVLCDGSNIPEMILIPPGSFVMGTSEAESVREKWGDDETRPQHYVTFHHGFWFGKFPVTRGEFAAFVADTGYDMSGRADGRVLGERWKPFERIDWRNPGFIQTDGNPVVCVSHADAVAYAVWLSGKTGRRYRLPSEAEWEYAARAGTSTARFWGEDREGAHRYANGADRSLAKWLNVNPYQERFLPWEDGFPFTSPVGSFEPSNFGLYDVLGNVWEWVADHRHGNYDGAPDDGSAWMNNGDRSRWVRRGGSWGSPLEFLRAGCRNMSASDLRGDDIGFRLAMTPEPLASASRLRP
jgi:formylglycine-generating enzyme required for sulfatase activity